MKTTHLLVFGFIFAIELLGTVRKPAAVDVTTNMNAPGGAVLERRVLDTASTAMIEFYSKY